MPKALAPTARQREVMDYIQAFANLYGRAPTRKQIANRFDITNGAASAHIRCLRKWRLLKVDKNTRGISLPA